MGGKKLNINKYFFKNEISINNSLSQSDEDESIKIDKSKKSKKKPKFNIIDESY
jgi:hypothetical protein